jgi:membrane protein implicated in regulation of membrane protease activity
LRAIKAVYNFIVGDMIILVGVVVTLLILALINNVSVLAPLRAIEGELLVVAVLGVLTTTLLREVLGKR